MARKKTGGNQAGAKSTGAEEEGANTPNVQADHSSIAIGGVSIGGDLSGSFTVGYTAEQVSLLLTQITAKYQRKPFDGRCPYKGLDVFEEEDAELFFGRERLVDDLVSRVKESRTVFITGPSGSGKSSLVRAGLIHALKQGAIKNLHSERWLYETMKPGREPMLELARVIASLAGTLNAGEEIRTKGPTDGSILAQWCEIALKDDREKRAVLFIDQFEEVFTQTNKETERLAFLKLLTQAASIEKGRVILLFAMRSDFVSSCASYAKLNALLGKQFIQIGAMQPRELVSAIAQPALRVGLPIDPDLIAQIINDMKGAPGALPLMQFALKDLFDVQQAKSGLIALRLYDYNDRGGIHEALQRHADSSFAELNPHEQGLARSIFSALIEVGRGTVDTRRTALFDELIPFGTNMENVRAVVQKLANARLVITDEQAGKDTLTISHEKLIDAWPWLKKLINENRDVIALQNEIASDAKEWEDHKRDNSYLYRGAKLAYAREQLTKKLILSDLSQRFLSTSYTRQRRTQFLTVSTVILLGAMSMLFAYLAATGASKLQRTNIVLAYQLAKQAQLVYTADESNPVSVLLAIRSIELSPSLEARRILLSSPSIQQVSSLSHQASVSSTDISLENNYALSGSYDGTARVWSIITGEEIARMTHDNSVTSVDFSPGGKYVVSGSADNTARVWESATGREVARMTHDNSVTSVAFSPDSKYVVSGSDDNTARVWESTTGREITAVLHDDFVSAVVFSLDGKYVVSGSWDHTARMWEANTGKEVARVVHSDIVNAVAISSDSKYLLSVSNDGTVRVLDISIGKEIARTTHENAIASVTISSDGRYILSGALDGMARLWLWQPDNIAESACAHLNRNLTITEWNKFFGSGVPYEPICQHLQAKIESTTTATALP